MFQPKILKLSTMLLATSIVGGTLAYCNDYKLDMEQQMNKYQQEVDMLNKKQEDILNTLESKDKEIEQLTDINNKLLQENDDLNYKLTHSINIVGTAYDLTSESCSKTPSNKDYGITATGLNLRGKDWSDKVAAVDPNVIPLKHYIYVVFDNQEYEYLNGWWYTGDTGNAVKGNIVDFYLGEGSSAITKQIDNFGRQNARITSISKTL